MKYEVIRQHFGDKMYMPGDERDLSEADATELVRNGVLRKPKAKAEPKVENKAEPAMANKSEPPTHSKRR